MILSRSILSGSALAAVSMTLATPALAQQAGLQIAVVDAASGAPVAGATVVVDNRETGQRRSLTTNAQGLVRLEALATGGAYVVRVAASAAYGPAQAEAVALRSNFASSVTLRVKALGGAMGAGPAIIVTGTRAVTTINTVNAEISASLSQKELAALPVEGRDVMGALVRLRSLAQHAHHGSGCVCLRARAPAPHTSSMLIQVRTLTGGSAAAHCDAADTVGELRGRLAEQRATLAHAKLLCRVGGWVGRWGGNPARGTCAAARAAARPPPAHPPLARRHHRGCCWRTTPCWHHWT